MAQTRLDPAAVYSNGFLQFLGDPVWADANDLSATSTSSAPSSVHNMHGWLPPLTAIAPSAVGRITIGMRGAATTTESGANTVGVRPKIAFANPGGGNSAPFFDIEAEVRSFEADATMRTVEWVMDSNDYDNLGLSVTQVAERMTQTSANPGMRAVVFSIEAPADGIRALTVAEAWVILATGQSAVRKYPRDDGLGHSSAPRKYPPTKARRIIGGYT